MLIREWDREDFSQIPAREMVEYFENLCAQPNLTFLSDVYGATTELISNVGQHAYPEYFDAKNQVKRYSLTVSEIDSQRFSVTVRDYGVTIPVSIFTRLAGKSAPNAPIQSLENDAELLNIAVNWGRSAPEMYRGKGLSQILDLVTAGSFDCVEIESRNGYLLYENAKAISVKNRTDITTGTKVTVFFSIPAQKDSTTIDISISKEFSRYPAGRYIKDGPYSGEAFREKLLVPSLEKYDQVFVDLDDVSGYGDSFLEEAFGGLVRNGNFSKEELKNRMSLKTKKFSLAHRIWDYIAESNELK